MAGRPRLFLIILGLLLILSPIGAVALGSAAIPPDQVMRIIASHLPNSGIEVTWSGATDAIVWQTRLPRILVGVGVGAILGVSGVVLQAIVRNPLAEPYVLGVGSGASAGAAVAIVVLGATTQLVTGLLAFAGALIATPIALFGAMSSARRLRVGASVAITS